MNRTIFSYSGLIAEPNSRAMRIAFVVGATLSMAAAAAATGAALVFASLVLPALHDLPPDEALRTKSALLTETPPELLLALLGTGIYSVTLVAIDILTRGWRASPWLIVGTVSYVVGVVGVTLFGIRPLEGWLLGMDNAAHDIEAWLTYATAWGGFNNVRLLAASVSSGFFLLAMLRR